ncbi:LuxR C-terminal-related transcriptional regulator [Ideonella sp. A 288]|uniref:helix-turn-helix transcriptional regulator n=1 Tax=Ideonella sp. A 288 TaxID=1962181 RepID=UPI001F458C65|nr:LuxR C-terminal-related transcriptional regulator [Ideonella sp. A 288]
MLSFARTKIQPPRQRPGMLQARPALDARLAEALATQRLVLVCAAAGYGKTSALARQVDALPEGTALAWVSCDAGDSPLRLFQCLISALEPFDPPWRVEPEALMAGAVGDGTPASRSRGLRAMVAELINALDACEVPHGVVVVDDLHRIEHPAVYEFLDLLLERLTPRWTLAIASRQEPPIALARLRALGELAEFRLDDLRFERDEARALVTSAGLDAATADALFERTQGWPVALRLAMHVLAGARGAAIAAQATAIDRPMFDFLAAEVFDRMAPDQREFLLQTSLLPELTASRCAALTGDPQAAMRLERIERAGLAVSTLAGTELTLRLHDLLREALERRLVQERPDALPGLCARAAASEPDPTRRIDFLLRACDHDGAARVLYQHAPVLLTLGQMSGVERLLERFPPGRAGAAPRLQHVRGLLAWARWDFKAMRDAMQHAEAGYLAAGEDDQALLALGYQAVALNAFGQAEQISPRLLALDRRTLSQERHLIVVLACLWHAMDLGELQQVGPLLDEMMDLLETTPDLSLWYRAHTIPRLNGLPGTADALDRYVEGVMRLTADTPSPLRAMARAQQALRELWQGHVDAAEAGLAAARADAQWLGDPPNVRGVLQLVETLVATARGEREAALDAARRMIDQHPVQRGPWSLAGNLFYAARAAAAFDDLPALVDHVDQLEGLRDRVPPSMVKLLRPLQGLRSWLEGDRAEAMRAWSEAIEVEDQTDRLGSSVEWRLRLAAALVLQGRDRDAVATLAPAAARVAGHAGVGGVLLARQALGVLAEAAAAGRLGAALGATVLAWRGLVQAAARREGATVVDACDGSGGSIGGLSSREIDVLQRIAAGDSNKLIARAFDLSPHTVKRHVANILDKLDLRSRGQAAAWYRDHGASVRH